MKTILLTLAMIAAVAPLSAQEETSESPVAAHTIRSAFDNMINESNNYQDFKVVKRRKLDSFIQEVSDSLKLADERLAVESKAKNTALEEVLKLQSELEKSRSEVAQAQENRDTITSAGMQMGKESFSALMWGLVIGLAAALLFVLFRNRSASSDTKDLRHRLGDIEEQLAQTKKKSLEREQELKREVQDYVNRLDALKPPR